VSAGERAAVVAPAAASPASAAGVRERLGAFHGRERGGLVAGHGRGAREHRVRERRLAAFGERRGRGRTRLVEASELAQHACLADPRGERSAGGDRLRIRVERLTEEALALERERGARVSGGAVGTAGEGAADGGERPVVLADREERVGVAVRRRGRRRFGRSRRVREHPAESPIGVGDVAPGERADGRRRFGAPARRHVDAEDDRPVDVRDERPGEPRDHW
jgi:hypothetical protein